VTGRLRLGVTPTVAGYFLALPLARFRRAFPNVDVAVSELDRAQIEARLVQGELDLAMLLASNLRDARRIATQPLLTSPRRLWLSPTHPLIAAPAIRLRDIVGETYLLMSIDDNEDTTASYWRRHGLRPKIGFRTTSMEAIRSLVASGLGVTILSDMVYRPWSLEGDRIEAREIVDAIPSLTVGLAWRKAGPLAECARLFQELCADGHSVPSARWLRP
jgi:DNA-binding transcriptional LysR family regulator